MSGMRRHRTCAPDYTRQAGRGRPGPVREQGPGTSQPARSRPASHQGLWPAVSIYCRASVCPAAGTVSLYSDRFDGEAGDAAGHAAPENLQILTDSCSWDAGRLHTIHPSNRGQRSGTEEWGAQRAHECSHAARQGSWRSSRRIAWPSGRGKTAMDDPVERHGGAPREALPKVIWDLVDRIAITDEAAALRRLDDFRGFAEMARRAAQRDLALARLELALRCRR